MFLISCSCGTRTQANSEAAILCLLVLSNIYSQHWMVTAGTSSHSVIHWRILCNLFFLYSLPHLQYAICCTLFFVHLNTFRRHFYFWHILITLYWWKEGLARNSPVYIQKMPLSVPVMYYWRSSNCSVPLQSILHQFETQGLFFWLKKFEENTTVLKAICYQQFKGTQQLQCLKLQDAQHALFMCLPVHRTQSSPTQVATTCTLAWEQIPLNTVRPHWVAYFPESWG